MRHPTLTKSARSLPTSARTTSARAPSSTGCADCSSGNRSIRERSTWANSLAMSRTLVRAEAMARQVKLEVDVPDDLPPVRGDRVHLQQVLLNLILNGMDALNGASCRERRVSVIALLNGAQTVEIAVSDTGSGIPVDKLAHVFDPFFTTKANGMGMGLPISRTIIEAHGGRFWAENNSGEWGNVSFHVADRGGGRRVMTLTEPHNSHCR